jgi:hypothetical protein
MIRAADEAKHDVLTLSKSEDHLMALARIHYIGSSLRGEQWQKRFWSLFEGGKHLRLRLAIIQAFKLGLVWLGSLVRQRDIHQSGLQGVRHSEVKKSFAVIVTCGTLAAGWLVEVYGELVEVFAPQAASILATISTMKAPIPPAPHDGMHA